MGVPSLFGKRYPIEGVNSYCNYQEMLAVFLTFVEQITEVSSWPACRSSDMA